MTAGAIETPWLNLALAAKYIHRSKRFVSNEVRAGRIRAARVGGRGELLFRREWLDAFLEDLATPVMLNVPRRRA
jgi:excisionase family DNA binding protein